MLQRACQKIYVPGEEVMTAIVERVFHVRECALHEMEVQAAAPRGLSIPSLQYCRTSTKHQ